MRNHTNKKLVGLLLACAGYVSSVSASNTVGADNAHFYKPAHYHGYSPSARWEGCAETRTDAWNSSFQYRFSYIDADKSRNKNGDKVPLFDLYGLTNALYLSTNVAKNPTMFEQFLAGQVNHSQENGDFGRLSFNGKFKLYEHNLDFRQNFCWGGFFEAHLPIRDFKFENISQDDRSPDCGRFSNNNPDWLRFKNNFDAILASAGYHGFQKGFSKTDVGDLSMYLGYEWVSDDCFKCFDVFRAMFKVGVLFPTGAHADIDHVFTIPTGYNDHWGIPIDGFIEFGLCEWADIGVRGGALFFFDHTETHRIKTHPKQSGWIKLAKGNAKEERGTLWYVGTDVLFDHLCCGLSLLVGYSFNKQEHDDLHPRDKCCSGDSCTGIIIRDKHDQGVANSDAALGSWNQHVLHFGADYDFSVHGNLCDCQWAPRLGFFYDWLVTGESVFDADAVGGSFGLDVRWDY